MPEWISTIFGTSAITPCAVMAIILNSILPPEGDSHEEKNLRPVDYGEEKKV